MSASPTPSDSARKFHNFPGAHYVLPSDEPERDRLDRQHRVLKRAYDDKLVWAPVDLVPGSAVLDCGTGTGIWLLDLADQVPDGVQLRGIDVQSHLFPPPRSNVKFTTSSVTTLPSEWSSKFQLVHQRLLTLALTASEWPTAFLEMKRVLAPGGWVQSEETGAGPLSWEAGPATARFQDLAYKLNASRGHMWDSALYIPGFLADAGFTNIRTEVREIPLGKWAGKEGCEARDNLIDVFRAAKEPVLNGGGYGYVNTGEDYDRFIADLVDEWDNTPGAKWNFTIFSAQKPASQAV
ncbi:hypothetical protein BOTBODRAFT_157519 [Botryobasidium botryosum FD-172 SS1]|uniref:Methyltransferase domain-containing protein n=1 Tax=Botryobasidium botryosum (strain FD-172 SS1) TaxID=930990 RepID=A0A067MVB5_BOTB1|nr:hypothetical protein BOTBODRAFT_157519 [Botryobasidium botryosum FD-172 SS1]